MLYTFQYGCGHTGPISRKPETLHHRDTGRIVHQSPHFDDGLLIPVFRHLCGKEQFCCRGSEYFKWPVITWGCHCIRIAFSFHKACKFPLPGHARFAGVLQVPGIRSGCQNPAGTGRPVHPRGFLSVQYKNRSRRG